MQSKPTSLCALIASVVICSCYLVSLVSADPSMASIQWSAAVDAAMTQLAQDSNFQTAVSSLGVPFIVPYFIVAKAPVLQ